DAASPPEAERHRPADGALIAGTPGAPRGTQRSGLHAGGRPRALLLCALVPLLLQCAAVAPRPEPRAPLDVGRGWRPAPALQRLIDPAPAVIGPSWLGADVATSVRLTDDHYLWLFGDTLLGSVETDCDDGSAYCDRRVEEGGFIANSIGTMTRDLDGSFF